MFGQELLKKFLSLIDSSDMPDRKGPLLHIVSCYFSPDTVTILPEHLLDKTIIYFDVKGLLSEIPVSSRFHPVGIDEKNILFHPKIYYFDGKDPILFISSSNFTMGSLNNLEAGYIFRGEEAKRLWDSFSCELEKLTKINGHKELNSIFQEREKDKNSNRWIHQDEAVEIFLSKRFGILEMATGTGKTRTAIKILNRLLENGAIDGAVITTFGTDLLDQWHKEILMGINPLHTLPIYRQYGDYKELSMFKVQPENSILLISKDFLPNLTNTKNTSFASKKLLICDEVHHMGASGTRFALDGKLTNFPYRLGLSATPEREYDELGNDFVESQIGPVIFRFGIEDAIKRGILCEFDYIPIKYELSEEDNEKMKSAYAKYHAAKKSNPTIGPERLFIDLARVKKLSKSKLPVFEKYLSENPDILERAIIFVETKEYGEDVQNIIINYQKDYHTYYGDDDRNNLVLFANKKLQCLITCKRISEGIDIKSVNTVVLFSTSRAKLETIQRIGRCLRIDPENPSKKAKVIDFVISSELNPPPEGYKMEYEPSDLYRYQWLSKLARVRREKNG